MQEIANAPCDTTGQGNGMTREDYISFIKDMEKEEEKAQEEPPRMIAPTVESIGVQVDPPPQNVATQMTPPQSPRRRKRRRDSRDEERTY